MAFDATYLQSSLAQLQLHGERGMVGGTWLPDNPKNTFLTLTEDLDVGSVRKSTLMMDFVLWDAGAKRKSPISVCALPIEHNFQGSGSTLRGNLYMVQLLGEVMSQSDGVIRALISDAHGTHSYIRKYLHGQKDDLPCDDIEALPWWKDILHKPLPQTILPRLPIQVCYDAGEVLWYIPGVCSWVALFKLVSCRIEGCDFVFCSLCLA